MNASDPNALAQQMMQPFMPVFVILIVAGAIVMFLGIVAKEKSRRNPRNSASSGKPSDKFFSTLFNFLSQLPWWVNVILAGVTFVILSFLSTPDVLPNPISAFSRIFVYIAPIFLLFIATVSGINSWGKRRLLDKQTGLKSLNNINWESYEYLVEEAYRRKGYKVTNTGKGADGGIDLILEHSGKKFYVQCKHWKVFKVGVKTVRELCGVVAADNVDGGIVITSGHFTQEAINWVNSKDVPVKLIEREELLQLIEDVKFQRPIDKGVDVSAQSERKNEPRVALCQIAKAPACPVCSSKMVLRTARKGPNPGEVFWGCTQFPKCKGTRPYVTGR